MSDVVEFDPMSGLPRRIQHYTILEELGRGAMGIVFRARDETLLIEVALKMIKSELAAEAVSRHRFLREAQASAALRDHDHIVPVYSVDSVKFGNERYLLYLTMPLLRGESLQTRLARLEIEPVPLKDQLTIGRHIANGLSAAHEKGMIHRDIKPGNIWLELRSGRIRAKILDFGLARSRSDTQLTNTGAMLGTPTHMAPEQWSSSEVTTAADLWSLGIVLYEMAAGQLPFNSSNAWEMMFKVREQDPPSLSKLNGLLPTEYITLIERLLSKKPADRPQSAVDVREEIRSIEYGLGIEVPRSTIRLVPEPPITTTIQTPIPIVPAQPSLLVGSTTPEEIQRIRREWAEFYGMPTEHEEDLGGGMKLEMTFVPPGKFWMGSPANEAGRREDERQHEITINRGYFIGKFAITQEQYEQIMNTNPSSFHAKGRGAKNVRGLATNRLPVEGLNWLDAQAFLKKLNDLPGSPSKRMYRLPTEAEWEYACRAGDFSSESLPFHAERPMPTMSSSEANFDGRVPWLTAAKGKCLSRTEAVESFKPNRFGLFDMHGNVWEWCSDWYADVYYAISPEADPVGPTEGGKRVLRGGCWYDQGGGCRAAQRGSFVPTDRGSLIGFRVVAPVPASQKPE